MLQPTQVEHKPHQTFHAIKNRKKNIYKGKHHISVHDRLDIRSQRPREVKGSVSAKVPMDLCDVKTSSTLSDVLDHILTFSALTISSRLSGSCRSPSKIWTTLDMSGLIVAASCEHNTPSFKTSPSCSLFCSWRSLSLIASRISPLSQQS